MRHITIPMTLRYRYQTPDGFDDLLMTADDEALTSLLFKGCFHKATSYAEK